MPRRFVPRALRDQLSTRPSGERRPDPPPDADDRPADASSVEASRPGTEPAGSADTASQGVDRLGIQRLDVEPLRVERLGAETARAQAGRTEADRRTDDEAVPSDEPAAPARGSVRRPSPGPSAARRRRPSPHPRRRPAATDDETDRGAAKPAGPRADDRDGKARADDDIGEDSRGGAESDTDPARRDPVKAPAKAPARPSGSGRKRSASKPAGRGTAARGKRDRGLRPSAARRRRAARRLHRLRVACLVLLIVAVLGAAGTALTRWSATTSAGADQSADEATSAAQAATPAILSYDYRNYDGSVRHALKYLGGGFRKKYRKNMDDMRDLVAKNKARVNARVSATSVVSSEPNRAVLLVFVDQYRQNSNIDGQKVDEDRVVLTMQKKGGRWKVTKLTAI